MKVAADHLDESGCEQEKMIKNEIRNVRLNDEDQSSNSVEYTEE